MASSIASPVVAVASAFESALNLPPAALPFVWMRLTRGLFTATGGWCIIRFRLEQVNLASELDGVLEAEQLAAPTSTTTAAANGMARDRNRGIESDTAVGVGVIRPELE